MSALASLLALVVQQSIAAQEVDQQIFFKPAIEYRLLHGTWDSTPIRGGERWTPSGEGDHFVEVGLRRLDGGRDVQTLMVASSGEVYWFPASGIIIDFRERGRVDLGQGRRSTPMTCDAVWSGVQGVSFSGGCWGPLASDPETGVWSKPCNKNNNKECKATVTFSSGSSAKKPNFSCDATTGGGMSGNMNTGSAAATNANDGSCD